MTFPIRQLRMVPLLVGLLVLTVAVAIPSDAAAAPMQLPLAQAETPTPTPTPQILTEDVLAPCNLRGSYGVEPRIVEEGGRVTVTAKYGYNCITEGTRQIDMVLVVEDTSILRAENTREGQQPLTNLKDGLQRLVFAVDPTNDSRIGMIKYGPNWTGSPPIGKGQEHFNLFLDNINRIRGALGGCANPGSALRAASGDINSLAKDDPTEPPSIMIIVDAGAPPCSGVITPQRADIADACDAAKAEKATVVLVALSESQGRLRGCNSRGWYYRSSDELGSDLPAIFEEIRDRVLRDQKPILTYYGEPLDTFYWEHPFGSAVPRPPDRSFFELGWEEPVSNPPVGNFQYSYDVEALPGSGGNITTVAVPPSKPFVQLIFADRFEQWDLPHPEICIARQGRIEQDCGAFIPRLTQEAYTPTPRPTSTPEGGSPPTETATLVPPSETPVATEVQPTDTPVAETATPTEDPGEGTRIYLPIAKFGE